MTAPPFPQHHPLYESGPGDKEGDGAAETLQLGTFDVLKEHLDVGLCTADTWGVFHSSFSGLVDVFILIKTFSCMHYIDTKKVLLPVSFFAFVPKRMRKMDELSQFMRQRHCSSLVS